MSLHRVFQKYYHCWREAVLMLKRPTVLLPFLLLALIKCGMLLLLRYFTHPAVSFLMIDIVHVVGGEESLHYPAHFVMLPYLYELATLPIVVGGFVLYGWGVFMIADRYDGIRRSPRQYVNNIMWNLPAFLFIGIIYTATALSVPFMIALGAQKLEYGFFRIFLERFSWFLGFGMKVLLVYALLFVKLYQDDLLSALRAGIRFAFKRLLLTVMVLLSVTIIHAPLDYLTGRSHAVAVAFSPERILTIILFGIILEILTGYYLYAATTYIAVGKKRVLP